MTVDTLTAPVKKGTVCGKVELYINDDQKIGEVDLVTSEDISHSELMRSWDGFASGFINFFKTIWPYVLIVVGVLVVLVVSYVIIAIVHNHKRNKPKYPDFKPRNRK